MRLLLAAYKTHVAPYYQSLFSKGYLALLLIFLAAIIYANYFIGFPEFKSPVANFIFDYCLYTIPFVGAYLAQYFFYSKNDVLFHKEFLLLLFIAPALFAIRVNAKIFNPEMAAPFFVSSFNYLAKSLLLIVLTVPLWIWKQRHLNGFAKTGYNYIYGLMLLLMLPVVFIAAGKDTFASVYPKFIFEAGITANDSLLKHLFFEICYGFDFFSIEFFFRGFLIFAFAKYVGIRAILPAACFYCCIHLGKPMPEAISSFFGGVLLGVISYNTKSIRSGLMLHLGIAWMMELFAWIIHHS